MPASKKQRIQAPTSKPAQAVKQSQIRKVYYGSEQVVPWFPSCYHQDLIGRDVIDQLYVCQGCFKYTTDAATHAAHWRAFCDYRAGAPGNRCYAHGGYEVFEIDGEVDTLFAQNLSLFGKLFIENKSVCFDVSGFVFYLLLEMGQTVGYFSKEKLSWDNNNLACILVFPPFQGRGCGQKLMAASYFLSRYEGIPGGPERPLSEPGEKSYKAFWSRTVAECILSMTPVEVEIDGKLTIDDTLKIQNISEATGIVAEDIGSTLVQMGVLKHNSEGKWAVSKQDVQEWVNQTGPDLEPPLNQDYFLIVHNIDSRDTSDGPESTDESDSAG